MTLLSALSLVVGYGASVVGSWTLMGVPFATFNANGTCVVAGEDCTYQAHNDVLIITVDGERDEVPFAVTPTQLTLVEGDAPVVLARVGAPAAPAAPTAPAAPAAPAAPRAPPAPSAPTPAPALDVKDPLAQLLLSSAWCSFTYNKNTGASSQSRIQYFSDGSWRVGARSEGYNSGANGTVSSQTDASSSGRWSVSKGQFWFAYPPQPPGLPSPPLFPVALKVTRNSNGYPIITSPDGSEYAMCQ